MKQTWKDYEGEAAVFFRSLGLTASTNVTLKGVRTSHAIDVVVTSRHAGFDVTWIVECKQWKTPVTKLHVLALREITTDLGADCGILLSEAGYQSGAIEAANLTNVRVTSIEQMKNSATHDIVAMRLRDLYDRYECCKTRHWDIPKDDRIAFGIRTDIGDHGYSGGRVLEYLNDVLVRAFRGSFPFKTDATAAYVDTGFPAEFKSGAEVASTIERIVKTLEEKLDAATTRSRAGDPS